MPPETEMDVIVTIDTNGFRNVVVLLILRKKHDVSKLDADPNYWSHESR
jgi:hypothetical protein